MRPNYLSSLRTVPGVFLLLSLASFSLAGPRAHDTEHDSSGADSVARPVVRIETPAGDIHIRLHPDAAPSAVATVTDLVDGVEHATGQLAGASFGYTRPRVEVRTDEAAASVSLPVAIDAEALGLHLDVISDNTEAMAVIQNELVPAYRRSLGGKPMSPQLEQWLAKWFANYEPGFLIGATRKEINEALGYRYQNGLASRPVRRGSVALVPASASTVGTSLSIALADMPQRTGKWMVIGEVVAGLDLLDRISTAPLTAPAHTKPMNYTPRDPVVISAANILAHDDNPAPIDQQGE